MMGKRLESYLRLLALHARLFRESYRLDAALILMGLLYVFGGQSELNMTVSKGLFLLVGFLCAALMASQIIRENTAHISFYLKLPIGRTALLALFYLALALPILATFTALFLVVRVVYFSADLLWDSPILAQRLFQVVFAIFFIKSLTVNSMIAMSIHFALIALYFIALGGVLLVLLILQELLMPFFLMTNFTLALLFLLSTYLVSFLAVKKIAL